MPFRYTLFIYHLIFSLIFYAYIMENGGDALGYWNLQADTSQQAETWMQHWGLGTFFIQWINYIPTKLLGIPFWLGNILYGLLSAWAWLTLYDKVKSEVNIQLPAYTQLIWFLPNMHFWTAGVGKESLIWIFLVLFLLGLNRSKKGLTMLGLSLIGMFLMRPLYACFLLFILAFWLIRNESISLKRRYTAFAVILLLLTFVMYALMQITHIQNLNWEAVSAYLDFQMQYLKGFNPDSYVPMENYAWPFAFFTMLFRPMPWEGEGILFLLAGMENLLALLAVMAALVLGIWKKFIPQIPVIGYGTLFLFFVVFSGSLLLNNFGIILRYKSVAMIFLYLWVLNTIFPVLKVILAKQITK